MDYLDSLMNSLINNDCMDILPKIPDKLIDLVVADPPYGVRNPRQERWDDKKEFKNIHIWLNECLRISKIVLWFCAGYMIPFICEKSNTELHRALVYSKPPGAQFAGAHCSNIWYSTEFILVFGDVPKSDKKKKYGYSCFNYRTIPYKIYMHPTTKPLRLIEDLIYFYSNEGDLILDPFLGSGTTVIAARLLKRRFIGIEIDKTYYVIAKKRFEKETHTNTYKLF